MSNYCDCYLTNKCEWCRITEENKRYREALKFYASELSWRYDLDYDALRDNGDIAREALGESE